MSKIPVFVFGQPGPRTTLTINGLAKTADWVVERRLLPCSSTASFALHLGRCLLANDQPLVAVFLFGNLGQLGSIVQVIHTVCGFETHHPNRLVVIAGYESDEALQLLQPQLPHSVIHLDLDIPREDRLANLQRVIGDELYRSRPPRPRFNPHPHHRLLRDVLSYSA